MVVAVAAVLSAAVLRQAATVTASGNTFLSFNRRRKWLHTVSSSYSSSSSRKLILYSKPGCCLCDGLKEKLHAANTAAECVFDLEVRDITTNSDWEQAYQFEIPVLAKLRPDGTEEVLPRLSPRLGVELVRKKILVALGE
ncbi:unnamed protein product [Cuscuta europaea]|uniref:Glutaredoxin-like protein n=1 Tax=Cuscuta europaea TaxID=41803 RepID=A0A9P0YYK9_CUSEU|nr:unnamed protein product [Cuscuta europaea]